MRKLLRQINVIILSFVLIFAPTYVLATTVAADGWSVSKALVQGATTTYNGVKNVVLNGKNYAATGVATVTPTAAQVGKMIVRTGAVLAVDLAIKTLIGAVDYVMDPENNRVKYFVVGDPTDPKDPSVHYYFLVNAFGVYKEFSSNLAAATDTCKRNAQGYGWKFISATPATFSATEEGIKYASCVVERSPDIGGETYEFSYQRVLNPAYNPSAQPNKEEKYLPYEAVASQVINDAMAEKADGKAYVSSVADTALDSDETRQIVGADVVNQQLNNSQSIPTNSTATGAVTPTTGTGTGDPTAQPQPSDITLNFPIFCDWAPTVCVAAQAAIDFPAKVETWIDKIFYKTEGLPQYDTQTDLYIHEQPEVKHVNINWGSVCPAPVTVPLSFMGITREITVVNYQYICDYAWIIKASVNMIASISAVYIVAGRKE